MLRNLATAGCTAVLLCAGCSESLSVRTYPPGAKVTLDGEFTGVSPLTKSVSRGDVAPIKYVIEKEGYRTEEGFARPRVAAGRIVAAVFTTGIVYLFRSPRYYEEFVVELTPIAAATLGTTAATDPASRLRQIDDLFNKGLITEIEHRRMRSDVLDAIR